MAGRLFLPRDVLILGASRTPIGAFCGGLSGLTASQLGAAAISGALRKARVNPDEVDALLFGHSLAAGCGQNPVRQAADLAKIPPAVDCASVNKGAASGLKAVMLAAQTVALGHSDIVVAGGMESMSKSPHFLRKARTGGYHYGHGTLEDSALADGLWDSGQGCHIGALVERVVRRFGLTREEQDNYTIESYRRAAGAWQKGAMDDFVTPVRSSNVKGNLLTHDEEYPRLDISTVASLRPLFEEGGTITAASTASLNDGAAAVVLCSGDRARDLGVDATARILSFADHSVTSEDFALAPHGAIRRAMKAARLSTADYYEIHEDFAATSILNMRSLDLDHSRVNVNGGSVALGSPLGAAGANLLCMLLSVLRQREAHLGCASVANGGGGASAMIIERIP